MTTEATAYRAKLAAELDRQSAKFLVAEAEAYAKGDTVLGVAYGRLSADAATAAQTFRKAVGQ